ncbi:hypothetical protein PHAVU_001G062200 [Phaseolus vulgaris]|uniref:Bifunctional inhibitor/plant lipid transfer protein/seed storage helical domain-containing protein n=1 Tax=Phaseolus vulgaris TaxID=3885 RepID=V7CT94_PHAVU|nr:hypothetical protein PHAVU_001G062200g [Phaseolus vulgaris]ESW33349.1 hypothetical protein PHAVU_001G062200g [Phaseolus vulgaris]
MKSVFVPFLCLVAVLVVTVSAIGPPKPLTCEQTQFLVKACLDFVTDKTTAPSISCCQGLNEVIVLSPTKEERLFVCKCLKEEGSQIPNLDLGRTKSLPKLCNLSKTLDCDSL